VEPCEAAGCGSEGEELRDCLVGREDRVAFFVMGGDDEAGSGEVVEGRHFVLELYWRIVFGEYLRGLK